MILEQKIKKSGFDRKIVEETIREIRTVTEKWNIGKWEKKRHKKNTLVNDNYSQKTITKNAASLILLFISI